jgi:hypothetical protein
MIIIARLQQRQGVFQKRDMPAKNSFYRKQSLFSGLGSSNKAFPALQKVDRADNVFLDGLLGFQMVQIP